MWKGNVSPCVPSVVHSNESGVAQEFKEFIDAESLMPLPTSDLRNPVCLELKTLRSTIASAVPTQVPLSNGGDIGSVDSSDTYASCNTHPSHSQGDLLDSNLYVNPLDSSPTVKKSASGDTALRSLGASPMEEDFKGFGPTIDRGSRGSLNDTPLPKHRKTRFQQGVKPRTRFGDPPERTSQESLQDNTRRRPSFMPTRSIASATRIINQHLFGIQTFGPGKNGGGSKSSLSVDSIDSRTSPVLDQHRRSKSILKKCDSGGRDRDPEMEKLIGSPNRLPPPVSPPTSLRAGKLPIKFVLDDLLEKHSRDEAVVENKHKERLERHPPPPPPLYICPPPPGDDHSPTEETKLLLHQTAVELLAPVREAASSGAVGGGPSSRHKHELHTS